MVLSIRVREIIGALRFGIASHLVRPRHLVLIAAGFAIADMTLIPLIAIPQGLERIAGSTGRDDIAVVFGASAQGEADSTLKPELAALIADLPGIAHDGEGRPLVAPQFVTQIRLRRNDGTAVSVQMRGISEATWPLLDGAFRASAGDRFRSGAYELVAGAAAASSIAVLDPGAQIRVRDSLWRVTGRFEGGGLWDSELWSDLAPLQAIFNAESAVSVVWARLETPAAFEGFEAALESDKRLRDARTELQTSYYARQVRLMTHFARIATGAVAVTLGLGASLAIGNAVTMALLARRREMAILRALGYRRASLAAALMIEVALIGVVTAGAVSWLAHAVMAGRPISTSTGTQAVSFALVVSANLVVYALGYALLLGVVSACWPVSRIVTAPIIAGFSDE
jgi:putative ABC transport system permease protein